MKNEEFLMDFDDIIFIKRIFLLNKKNKRNFFYYKFLFVFLILEHPIYKRKRDRRFANRWKLGDSIIVL